MTYKNLLLLCAAITFVNGSIVPLINNITRASVDSFVCNEAGWFCDGCQNIINCYKDINGDFIKEEIGACPEQTSCLNGQCVTTQNDKCDPIVQNWADSDFKCSNPGTFPHPYSVISYYVCPQKDVDGISHNCPSGFSYDPVTTRCDEVTIDASALTIPACRSIGFFPLPKNTAMYYWCITKTVQPPAYIPKFFYCPTNTIYIDGKCQGSDYKQGILPDGKCKDKGQYYVKNCNQYNDCIAAGVLPLLKTCAANNKFDFNTKKCVPYKCM